LLGRGRGVLAGIRRAGRVRGCGWGRLKLSRRCGQRCFGQAEADGLEPIVVVAAFVLSGEWRHGAESL
jgi:hypothetical protein